MNPQQQATQLSLGDRTSGSTSSTPEAINYGFLHRGSIVMATGAGAMVRLELYQRRGFDGLSLQN